jgi:hypothetical protein
VISARTRRADGQVLWAHIDVSREKEETNQMNGYHASWSRKDPKGIPKELARLIQKIYEMTPDLSEMSGRMRIISFIEDEEVTERILKHFILLDI